MTPVWFFFLMISLQLDVLTGFPIQATDPLALQKYRTQFFFNVFLFITPRFSKIPRNFPISQSAYPFLDPTKIPELLSLEILSTLIPTCTSVLSVSPMSPEIVLTPPTSSLPFTFHLIEMILQLTTFLLSLLPIGSIPSSNHPSIAGYITFMVTHIYFHWEDTRLRPFDFKAWRPNPKDAPLLVLLKALGLKYR